MIQDYPQELDYVNAKLAEAHEGSESFLVAFLNACLRADDENYAVIQVALRFFITKYPAKPERLAAEKADRE